MASHADLDCVYCIQIVCVVKKIKKKAGHFPRDFSMYKQIIILGLLLGACAHQPDLVKEVCDRMRDAGYDNGYLEGYLEGYKDGIKTKKKSKVKYTIKTDTPSSPNIIGNNGSVVYKNAVIDLSKPDCRGNLTMTTPDGVFVAMTANFTCSDKRESHKWVIGGYDVVLTLTPRSKDG